MKYKLLREYSKAYRDGKEPSRPTGSCTRVGFRFISKGLVVKYKPLREYSEVNTR